MSAVIRPKHRDDARRVTDAVRTSTATLPQAEDVIAQALAEAEEYGVRKALHRLGPCIADAEIARAELAAEVDL